jgi:hypothetical protein
MSHTTIVAIARPAALASDTAMAITIAERVGKGNREGNEREPQGSNVNQRQPSDPEIGRL